MISGCGRGRGRSRYFRGRGCGYVGDGHGSYGGRQSASEKDSGNVGIVDTVTTFLKNAGRNLIDRSGHSYLILILLPL